MLIEFSVANFRSFRERQTFQMTAAPRLGKKENTFPIDVDGEKLPNLLKVATIYGGNASGKSNLIRALGMIERLAKHKPDASAGDLPVHPFRFDKDLLDKPSTFEIHFVTGRMRYQFLVGATRDRITDEVLISYPRGKAKLLYSRKYIGESDKYSFGDAFEGDSLLQDAWKRLTSPKSLFISQAVANSSEDLQQLRAPFEWLTDGLFVLDDGPRQLPIMGERISAGKGLQWQEDVSKFLSEIDVPIASIRWDPGKEGEPVELDSATKKGASERKGKIKLIHETRLGSAEFDLSEESSGTRNLIGFWLPTLALEGFGNLVGRFGLYGLVIVDELDNSLHPDAVAHIVHKHINSGAKTQLIFTTHDTHLMSTKLLRRDQFWVTDRNGNGATRLTSIHSFTGREGEDVEKRYFEGRYRGLPIRRGT